jgi:foldase protein PrsA
MGNMAAKKTKSKKKSTKKKAKTSIGKKSTKKSTKVSSKASEKKKEKNIMQSKLYIALVVLLVVAGTLYLLRGQFLAAMVDGIPITRFAVLQQLENQSGQQILDQLVNESLIAQEAKEQDINIPKTDIDAEIEEIQNNLESQGQSLEELLAFQGMTMEDLQDRIDTQLTLEKLLGDRVTVEQEEIDEFIEQSSEQIPEDMSAEEIEQLARDQLVQSKLQTEIQKYLEELKESADIEYFGSYQPASSE